MILEILINSAVHQHAGLSVNDIFDFIYPFIDDLNMLVALYRIKHKHENHSFTLFVRISVANHNINLDSGLPFRPQTKLVNTLAVLCLRAGMFMLCECIAKQIL